jgi:hypothetical protein
MKPRRLLIASLILVVIPPTVGAQQLEPFAGRVQYIYGSTLVLAVPPPPGSSTGSIRVDLSRVPQDQYSGLRSGDEIVVMGAVAGSSSQGYRVIGFTIEKKPVWDGR